MKKMTIFVFILSICHWAVAETNVAWQIPKADVRQVFEIHAAALSKNSCVNIPCGALKKIEGALLFIDPAEPTKPLAYFKDAESYSVVLNGELSPERTRQIVAYRGKEIAASPILNEKPKVADDYAAVKLGSDWDFEDGKTPDITSFGNSRDEYGDVTVENGWLRFPVLGNDAYFIYGMMWGDPNHPKNLKIDSNVYRFLEIRVKQSCHHATWKIYVTDKNGNYRQTDFQVKGTEPQTFRFDFKELFPDFWDGREVRALRIDPIKHQPKTVAEIDFIRLLPAPPTIIAGPIFSRAAIETRNQVRQIKVDVPAAAKAGQETECVISLLDNYGKPVISPQSVFYVTQTLKDDAKLGESKPDAQGRLKTNLQFFEKTEKAPWKAGLADDLGMPMFGVWGKINVTAGTLAAYRLTAKEFVDVQSKEPTAVEIIGIDRFGNEIPADIAQPKWNVEQGGSVISPEKPLRGTAANPSVSIFVQHSGKPLTTHRITLTDENGITGSANLTTVAYRPNTIKLNENGYLISPDGSLFYPVGGFYANWPHVKPNIDGAIHRSLDLFPCDAHPYTHGFPWKEDVEKKVIEYLDHCQAHGVNTLRLMLRNMDLVGHVDPVQLQAVLHFFDLARPRGIKFNVTLFEDYTKPPYYNRNVLEKVVLPHYTSEELAKLPAYRKRFLADRHLVKQELLRYGDRDVMQCHQDYLRELIPILAGREEVLCYEYENEMHSFPAAWCQEITAFIRSIDPYTPILGNPDPVLWPVPLVWRNCPSDLIAVHTYNNGQPNADMGTAFLMKAKWTAQTKKPFSTGEGGVYDGQIPYEKGCTEQRIQGARDHIWMTFCAGGNGALYWTIMHEKIIAEFGKIAPVIKILGVDLKTVKRRRPAVAVVMPTEGTSANQNATDIGKRLLELGVDFDTPPKGEDADYAVHFDAATAKPEDVQLSESLRPTVAEPGTGWDMATLLSDDGRSAILYLRNVAGGIKNYDTEKHPCYCRNVQPAEAAFRLEQPQRWKKIVVYELDSDTAKAVKPDAAGKINLGTGQSDYVIGLTP